jgi:hypothetical protein
MTDASLGQLLDKISGILRVAGYEGRAKWIDERNNVLRNPEATEDSVEFVLKELHGIVLGMGGLFDLRLTLPDDPAQIDRNATSALKVLADQLFEATRGIP